MRNPHFLLALALLLMGPALADEIFVNNRPFKGSAEGSGPSLYLELAPLAKMLKLEVQAKDGVHSVNSLPIRVKEGMVLLESLAQAANLKVLKNTSMGTVDIYKQKGQQKTVPRSSRGGPEDQSQTASSSPTTSGPIASAPAKAVENYFSMIKRVSDQLDFSKPADFDTYLAAHRPIITKEAFDRHKPIIDKMKTAGMGGFFDEQFSSISSTKAKVLSTEVNGNTAQVRAQLNVLGKTEVETFECKLQDGTWRVDPGF